ncbi:DNA polymerase beta superfamily protein [Rhodococcus cercidiphylli]|uniref:DNA polymerase beta superfamily protein n=1 Tax=Rhodococcus cercidiphylli TaxID=489916 RepID=UPI00374E2E52
MLLLLFIPPQEIATISEVGRDIQAYPEMFISNQAAHRFAGYLAAQKERMLGLRSQRTNRPELVDVHGFDTKFAYHAVRLGLQGVELMSTGRVALPMPEPDRTWLTDLRKGKHTKEEALERTDDLHDRLQQLASVSAWPDRVDMKAVDEWLVNTHHGWWRGEFR